MRNLSIVITKSVKKDTDKKKQLSLSIQKKRKELKELILNVEMLKANLQLAENEYTVKVGSLFLKDNHLDLEIIRLRNLLQLIKAGFSQAEANEQIAKTYYAQQIEIEKEEEKIDREKEIFDRREKKVLKPDQDIKKLWKKLISRFHPDLVQKKQEKLRREIIMKQINRAFQEGDYELLLKIDHENIPQNENSIDTLEDILESILFEINQNIKEYKSLKTSQWYKWMEKINAGKKRGINIFAGIEKQLLRDISSKTDLINELKSQLDKAQSTDKQI